MTQDFYRALLDCLERGQACAVATIVSRSGSTPRHEAAKILIREDGTTLGSIGGGCVEGEVIRKARGVITSGKPLLLHFDLDQDFKEESGLICGGSVEVYVEAALPDPTLVIFGAGHVAQPLARMAKQTGFRVVVVDERREFANRERYPDADAIHLDFFEDAFRKLPITPRSYLVIVTRGHQHDQTVLRWAMTTPACYIGMIGSRKKVGLVFQNLKREGVPVERLRAVHAPIGLDIGADAPEEIAVSILAQLIQVRRRGPAENGKPPSRAAATAEPVLAGVVSEDHS